MIRLMKCFALFLLATAATATTIQAPSRDVYRAWHDFKLRFTKSYGTIDEEQKRFRVFLDNLDMIDERNKHDTAVHGITKFMDLTPDEFKATFRTCKVDKKEEATFTNGTSSATSYVRDWTSKYTTPIKDQGYCGSCWAFSATEQIESDAIRSGGSNDALSTQQMTSCTKYVLPGVGGCNGGTPEKAFSYAKIGLVSDDAYAYTSGTTGKTGTCSIPTDATPLVYVQGYENVASGADDEDAMAQYVDTTGPLSIVVDASTWSSYTSGIMSTCGTNLDHAVQVVGVDSAAGYWKVRNSWGTSWGEAGYIRLAFGQNTCGIAMDANYAVL